jgi:hypothetical protein
MMQSPPLCGVKLNMLLCSFDEPEDLDAKPEREIVTPEMELARLEAQKKASWIQRLRKNKKDASGAASTDMSRRGSTLSNISSADGKPNDTSKNSLATADIGAAYDEDDEKEAGPVEDKPSVTIRRPYDELESDITSRMAAASTPSTTSAKKVAPAKKPAPDPSSVKFDIAQIREEIAKDDGSGQLPSTQTTSLPTRLPAATQSNRDLPSRISAEIQRTTPKRLSYSRSDTEPNLVPLAQQQKEQEALERQEAEYEARLAAEQEEAEARTPTASTSYATPNPFADPSSLSSSFNHPYPSASTSSPYGFSNPFASSSASFAFNDNIGNTQSHHSSSLSFGSDDGTITHIPIADQDIGSAPPASAWNTRTPNGTSSDPYIKQASDPWASRDWDINPKW